MRRGQRKCGVNYTDWQSLILDKRSRRKPSRRVRRPAAGVASKKSADPFGPAQLSRAGPGEAGGRASNWNVGAGVATAGPRAAGVQRSAFSDRRQRRRCSVSRQAGAGSRLSRFARRIRHGRMRRSRPYLSSGHASPKALGRSSDRRDISYTPRRRRPTRPASHP
jgi:hypothetical protein